jgi:hypothetical protein
MTAVARLLRSIALPIALLGMVLGGVQSASCEMHGLGAMQAQAPSAAGHAHGAAHGASHGQHDAGDCCCTCIGDCAAPLPAATVPTTITIRVAETAAEPRRLPEAQLEWSAPSEPDRLLPFANGPPTAV